MVRRTCGLVVLFGSLVLATGCVGRQGRRCCPRPCAVGSPGTTATQPAAPDVWAFHAAKYDADQDGRITAAEYGRGTASFQRLDRDHDAALTQADFAGPMRMDQLISRIAVARLFQADTDPALGPEEVAARFREIDTNRDGRLARREFERGRQRQRDVPALPVPAMPPGVDPFFGLRAEADRDGDGALSLPELQAYVRAQAADGETIWHVPPMPDPGKLPEAMQGGVAPGAHAPDFTLGRLGGGAPWALSDFKGKQPVALIFGSYT